MGFTFTKRGYNEPPRGCASCGGEGMIVETRGTAEGSVNSLPVELRECTACHGTGISNGPMS